MTSFLIPIHPFRFLLMLLLALLLAVAFAPTAHLRGCGCV